MASTLNFGGGGSQGKINVTNSDTEIVPANANRTALIVSQNGATKDVYISVGKTAVDGEGYTLVKEGGRFVLAVNGVIFSTEQVNGIVSSGNQDVHFIEFE